MIQSFLSDVIEQSLDELKLKNIILTAPISANKLDNLLKSKFGGDRYTADLSSDISFGDFCANITNLDDNSVIVIKNINNADEEFTKLLTHLLAKRQIHVIIGEDNLKKDVFIDIAECSFIVLLHEFESINHPLSEYFNIQINLSSKDLPAPILHKTKSNEEVNSMKIGLEFQIKRGLVDENFIDDEDTIEIINNVKRLCIENNFEDAVNYLLPKLNFEWIWSNGDSDPNDYFLDPDDIAFDCNKDNCLLKVGVDDENLVITANVEFFLNAKNGTNIDELKDWLNDNSMYACGYVGAGSWGYAQSDGDNIWVTSVNGEDVNLSSEDISDRLTRNIINSVPEMKTKLNLTIKNSDSYEEEACELIESVTNKELHLADKLNKLISDGTVKSFAKFYANFIGDKLQKIESPFYDRIFSKLTSIAWDNYGWNDVVVEFVSIEVDGKSFSWEDDDDIELINTLKIQLAHGADDEEPFMYFVG
jgi:hypothetical protein